MRFLNLGSIRYCDILCTINWLEVFENEKIVDDLVYKTDRYLERIPTNELSEREFQKHIRLDHALTDIERAADLANNMAVSAMDKIEKEKKFTKTAQKEMEIMFRKARLSYKTSIKALKTNDKELAAKVIKLEDEIDSLEMPNHNVQDINKIQLNKVVEKWNVYFAFQEELR